MKEIIITVLGVLIGVAVLGAGLYYRVKEKNDKESQKIYSVVSVIGAVILIAALAKIIVSGL